MSGRIASPFRRAEDGFRGGDYDFTAETVRDRSAGLLDRQRAASLSQEVGVQSQSDITLYGADSKIEWAPAARRRLPRPIHFYASRGAPPAREGLFRKWMNMR